MENKVKKLIESLEEVVTLGFVIPETTLDSYIKMTITELELAINKIK